MCAWIALLAAVPTRAVAATLEPTPLPALPGAEAEPNDAPASASPIASGERVRANLSSSADVDYYSFTALAGERVFANTVTAGSNSGGNTVLALLQVNAEGAPTTIEEDNDDGSQSASAASIAGALIPADGSYLLKVSDGGPAAVSPYDLYLQLRSGVATAETEPNKLSEPNSLAGGEVAGSHALPGDEDWFSLQLQAGDTVFLSMALIGESSKAQLGFGLAGDPGRQTTLSVPGPAETFSDAKPSEALTMTVATSGVYYVKVASTEEASAEVWGYDLSATVVKAVQPECRRYSSGGGAITDGRLTSFQVPVDDAAQITRAAVGLELAQSSMADLDASLRSPSGTEVPLFNAIGSSAEEGPKLQQSQMQVVFDDFAAVPPMYRALRPLDLQPEVGGRLGALNGQQSNGTWTLGVRDTQMNSSVGNVKAINLILCGPQLPPPAAAAPVAAPPQAKPAPPRLTGLTISPARFRAARAGAMVRAKRPVSGGALVSYEDSAPGQTNFVLFQAQAGRKVGARCVKQTRANEAKKPCTRYLKLISFVRNDAAGRNQFGFTGRVAARKLPPGEYLLQGRAYSSSGLTSDLASVTFTVLPPVAAKSASSAR